MISFVAQSKDFDIFLQGLDAMAKQIQLYHIICHTA